jgi:hypothetical protein
MRITAPEEWLFDLQLWVMSQGISVWLVDLEPYEHCRVAGVVERLRIDPLSGSVDVSLIDGTGVTSALWQIRRPTPQLALVPGRGVVLDGQSTLASDGSVAFEEPTFQASDLGSVGEGA